MTSTEYSEAFWGSDFTSTAGFEALSQRIRDGRNMCKDVEDYISQRYEMEKSYCKKLSKLQKSMKHREELGVLERTWNKLRDEVDKMVSIHNEAASHFQRQMDEIKKFNDQQWSSKKAMEDSVKKSQSNKNNQYDKCINSQKTYKDKCREKDSATDNLKSAKSLVTTLPKDMDKALKAKSKAEDEANKAETAYKASLELLEHLRQTWEKEMEEACRKFQELDEERIRFLREHLWVSVNIDSQCAVDRDECCESVRLVLENCVVEEDIRMFIEKHQTGFERPAPLQFENYYMNAESIHNAHTMLGGGQRSGPPGKPPHPYNRTMLDNDPTYATIMDGF